MTRAFTLVETIITIAISVVALIALTNLFLTFTTVYGYQQAFIAAGSSGAAMNALRASVLPAAQVLASHTFSGTTYSSSANTLVLELPAINSSGAPMSGANDYVAFYVSGTMLYRLTEAAAGSLRVSGLRQLSTALASLSFTYDSADFTQVTNVIADLTTQTAYKQQAVENHVREQLYLRNRQPLP